jgi:hypothetical protein
VHVVVAPVALLVTVSTVPNGSVGLAHIPGAAPEYHVASPTSEYAAAGGAVTTGAVVVVVVGGGGGGGGAVVVVVGGDVVVVVGGDVVVVVGGDVVVVVVAPGARNANRCVGRSTPQPRRATCAVRTGAESRFTRDTCGV